MKIRRLLTNLDDALKALATFVYGSPPEGGGRRKGRGTMARKKGTKWSKIVFHGGPFDGYPFLTREGHNRIVLLTCFAQSWSITDDAIVEIIQAIERGEADEDDILALLRRSMNTEAWEKGEQDAWEQGVSVYKRDRKSSRFVFVKSLMMDEYEQFRQEGKEGG